MKHYVVFDTSSGDIKRTLMLPDEADVSKQPSEEGEDWVEYLPEPHDPLDMGTDRVDPRTKQLKKKVKEPNRFASDFQPQFPTPKQFMEAMWDAMDQGVLPKVEPVYSRIKAFRERFRVAEEPLRPNPLPKKVSSK